MVTGQGAPVTERRSTVARPLQVIESRRPVEPPSDVRLRAEGVSVRYGAVQAIDGVTVDIFDRAVTAIIGPSGCGKSTLLRVFNRMNDLIANARVVGRVELDGGDVM